MATRMQRLRDALGTRKAKIILGVLGVLIAFRLALPHIVKLVINNQLANLEGYRGRVLDVDIALWRGSYALDGLLIEELDEEERVPFVEIERTDISIEWGGLFRGEVVAEIVMDHPQLNFTATGENGKGNDWRETVDDMVPITISHFAMHDGEVHYRDFHSSPHVDVVAQRIEAEVTGLSTRVGEGGDRLPARLDVHATVMHSGALSLSGTLDPWREQPTFDLALSMRRLRAVELNPFLRAYAGVDAEAGRVFVYSEVRADGGRFRGYVKPMVEGLSVFRFGEDGDFIDQLGDLAIQVLQDIFENHGTDRFATRITLSGSFDAPGVNPIEAVIGILSNAFIEAFRHGLDNPEGWQPEPRARHASAD